MRTGPDSVFQGTRAARRGITEPLRRVLSRFATQRISAWHERIGESAKQIVVEAGRTVRIEFALPVEDAK